jgi:stearoyl-CoA desaturase (delta-9 desaturase)
MAEGSAPAAVARHAATEAGVAWRYAGPILLMHVLACLAVVPWLFSWAGVVAFVAGVYFFGVGINIGFHRLLTHRSFACPLWLEHSLATIGVCCAEDAPATWVAAHRMHHKDSDREPDPHTPLAGFVWGHMGWLLRPNREVRSLATYDRFARDLLRDPYYRWLQRGTNVLVVYFAHAALYAVVGLVAGRLVGGSWGDGLQLAASLLVWGVALRTVVVWHISWSVNSLSHLFGYQNYATRDNSRNNWLVALLTSGEGWHNNHHAEPTSASNWRRWWEVDPMFLVIVALERVGLAWDVVRPRLEPRA